MWFRLSKPQFVARRGERNRRALKGLVASGQMPGLLAYARGEPVGWCAVEPREAYPRLARSRLLAPVDAEAAWSVTCFFVAPSWRGRGVTSALLEAAAEHAQRSGARVLEAYPVDRAGPASDAALYHGVASTFRRAGFEEVARRSPIRPIMRRALTRRGASLRPTTGGRAGARPPPERRR